MKVVWIAIAILFSLVPVSKGQNYSQPIGLQSRYASRHLQTTFDSFETFVDVDVTLDRIPSPKEKDKIGKVMSDSFKTTYNTLAAEYYDPLRRRVESVQVASATFQAAGTPGNQGDSRGKYRFRVPGTCRACPSKSSIYKKNDAIKSRTLTENQKQLSGPPSKPNTLENHAAQTAPPNVNNLPPTAMPTLRPTLSKKSCRAMASNGSQGSNNSLSFEIVAPSQSASYITYGESYSDCAPPLSEFLSRYKSNLKDVVQVVAVTEDQTSTKCQSNLDCMEESVCIAEQCVGAGNPLFALMWKGNSNYQLQVRAPNGQALNAGTSPLTMWNVKMIMFPFSGGPIGRYFIDVRIPNQKNAKLNSWTLVMYPGENTNELSIIRNGTGTRRNMNVVFKQA